MSLRHILIAAAASATLTAPCSAASASFLFWSPPDFSGPSVKGDEPGLGLPMPGASAAELQAHLLWNMRAGLNVAALQCQFSPTLATVKNYNTMLMQHSGELNAAYTTISAYFKRTGGKKWQTTLDQYTTKTYNGFSTLHAQLGFCETAGAIGRDALEQPSGKLVGLAQSRMREFRNSLVPRGDSLFSARALPGHQPVPTLNEQCWDKNGMMKKKCWSLPLT